MRQDTCRACRAELPLNALLLVDAKPLCDPCARREVASLRSFKATPKVERVFDPTVCAKCEADNGDTPYPLRGRAPFCAACARAVYERPFPTWLKASAAALTVALALALLHAAPYFAAGRDYVRAQRLMDQKRYHEAIPGLERAVEAGPDATEIRLELAKAYLEDGEPDKAFDLTTERKFPSSALFDEVKGIFARYERAATKAQEAADLAAQDRDVEAASRMREAASICPELPALGEQAVMLDASAAFDRKDYDGFERMAQGLWDARQNSENAAMLASAVACRYALTGEEAARGRAEELLAKAGELATTDEERSRFAEYSERIAYRLRTREIVDRKEYDRRFRPEAAKKEASR